MTQARAWPPARSKLGYVRVGLAVGMAAVGCAQVLGFEKGVPERAPKDAPTAGEAHGGGGSGDQRLNGNEGGAAGEHPDLSFAGGGEGGSPGAGSGPCGNGRIDEGEVCDGSELGDATCRAPANEVMASAGGVLKCSAHCEQELDQCYLVRQLDVGTHVCVLLSNERIKCWGYNASGELGIGDQDPRGEESDEMAEKLPFVDLGGRRPLELAVGGSHTCALLDTNEVVCWGDNSSGQLGHPTNGDVLEPSHAAAVDLGSGTIEHIAAGGAHTCALFDTGRLKCWGKNATGQLGLGHDQPRGKLFGEMGENLPFVEIGAGTVVEMVLGSEHTCVRTDFGQIKCWGANTQGQLGQGTTEPARGDGPNEMGEQLQPVNLGGFNQAEEVVAGGNHTCALIGVDVVKCWGENFYGQLGYEDTDPRGLSPEQMGDALPAVELGAHFVWRLAAGYQHTCVWFTDDRVKCWGDNEWGQLGLGDRDYRGDRHGTMGTNLPFVDFGKGHDIAGIRAGDSVTCLLLDLGRVKCWGYNDYGSLGLGLHGSQGTSSEQMGDSLPFVAL